MERSDIKKNLQLLTSVYNKMSFNQDQVDLWVECFKDCNQNDFECAIRTYIKTNEFPPVVASIMKLYEEIRAYKRDMKRFIKQQFSYMAATWGEVETKEALNEFARMVVNRPKSDRKDFAKEYVIKAVTYHHNCEYEGKEAPTLQEYMRGKR